MINCVNVVHPLVIFIRTSKEQIHNSFVLCHHWWIRVKLNVWGGSTNVKNAVTSDVIDDLDLLLTGGR